MLPGTHWSLAKMKGPEPIDFLDLLLRVGQRLLLAHDGGDRAAALAERFQHHAVGLACSTIVKVLSSTASSVGDVAHQPLADAVLGAPALERGDDVLGGDRRAVVELQPVAQGEGVGQPVGADLVLADHLRLRLLVGVVAEQRVVDQRAVDVGDGLRRPDRIDARARRHASPRAAPSPAPSPRTAGQARQGRPIVRSIIASPAKPLLDPMHKVCKRAVIQRSERVHVRHPSLR